MSSSLLRSTGLLGFLVATLLASTAHAESRPNIVFILLDNVGQEWFGCYGSEERCTPNIDALAKAGVRVENCYTPPVCGPSRTVLLTGRYPHHTGFRLHHDAALYGGGGLDPAREILFPRLFREAGYATCIAGKWQINNLYDEPGVLARHGFDEQFVWPGSIDATKISAAEMERFRDIVRRQSYEEAVEFNRHIESRYWDPVFIRNGKREELRGQSGPDATQTFALDFLRRNREKPFLLYLPMMLTHGQNFTQTVVPTPDNKSPDRPKQEMFAGMLRYADKLIGELVAELEKLSLRENTIIFVASDNGTEKHFAARRNGRPVQGDLYSLTEAGGNVVLLANCPRLIPGGRTAPLADFTDVYPTVCELAGVPLSTAHRPDGKSLARYLRGKEGARPPRNWTLNEYHETRVVRDTRFKLYSDGRFFDANADPVEAHDLSKRADPQIAAARAHLQEVLDSLPPDEPPPFPLRSLSAFKIRGEARRHERVAERRKQTHIICHRGAHEFAHENTLEAYRATFELGADGNEIDIRRTKDGVLVCFHDDMLDRLLTVYGTVGELTWDELRVSPFREPGPFAKHCRIPTLAEVFELHKRHGGLLHLDIKEKGLDKDIAELLDKLDMWDHVAYCNAENAPELSQDKRIKLCRYKAPGLFAERADVDPAAIAAALARPGDGLIVDDPRVAVAALGRKIGEPSREPVTPDVLGPPRLKPPDIGVGAVPADLKITEEDTRSPETPRERVALGRRIWARARAAETLAEMNVRTPEVFAALEERVRNRSLHKEWMYHGFDGAMALRSLILLRAPRAVDLARFTLWRDDPALEAVADPRFKNPRAWTDFRVKMVVFPALAKLPGEETEKLCRDYLSLSEEEARRLGPPQFEEAAKTLLTVSPKTETALELLKHRSPAVRGRVVLFCLAHSGEPWAESALKQGAPHALAWLPK